MKFFNPDIFGYDDVPLWRNHLVKCADEGNGHKIHLKKKNLPKSDFYLCCSEWSDFRVSNRAPHDQMCDWI